MDKPEYQLVESRFRNVSERYGRQLSDEARHNVEHYIEVAEIEMACESFVLSVIEEQVRLSPEAKKELLQIILALGLDKESTLRADFWQIAQTMLSNQD
jgi:hypothetical protein